MMPLEFSFRQIYTVALGDVYCDLHLGVYKQEFAPGSLLKRMNY